MDKIPMTVEGEKLLREELLELKTITRPQISEAIKEAREKGDLKENAEYHAAKEQQSLTEGRIQEIDDIIARANVIDITQHTNSGRIIFGSTVDLLNIETKEKKTLKIVGKDEANIKENLVYFKSPMGKGLIGKNLHETVEINTPSGKKNYKIQDVKYI